MGRILKFVARRLLGGDMFAMNMSQQEFDEMIASQAAEDAAQAQLRLL